jgi:hypothetical protein
MPPTMITFTESPRNASEVCRFMNVGYFDRIGLSAGFSKCDSRAITPVCWITRKS